MEKLPKRGYWIAILVILSVGLYTAWYLHLNPQHLPLFLATTIIAIGFVVTMALLPEYRRRLTEKVMAHHAKEKSLGRLYHYRNVALVTILISILVFPVLWQYQLIPSHYVPFSAVALLIVNIIASTILIIEQMKTIGKWVLLLIAIGVAIAISRFLM